MTISISLGHLFRSRLGFWCLICVSLLCVPGCWSSAGPQKPNLLLITLDTTRADRIGAYGYAKARTPILDQLAAEGVLFERAYSPAPLTLPVHASLMTGLYPPEHGLRTNGLGSLPTDRTTLSEILSNAGYETGAFVASFVLDGKFGLNQGFSEYDDNLVGAAPTQDAIHRFRDGKLVVDSALAWLQKPRTKPFFCWVHLYDPHSPYDAHSEQFNKAFDDSPYDGEIAYTDALVGRLLDFLKQHPNTLVVLVGDHGESLGEHDEIQHGYTLYNATQQVPLIIRGINGRGENGTPPGTRLAAPVSLVDAFPTMLELLQLPVPKGISGRSFAGALQGLPLEPRLCYGTTDDPFLQNGWSPLRSVTTDRYRYIRTAKPELYDLNADPNDLTNLAAEQPELMRELEGQLADLESSMTLGEAAEVQLSNAEQKALASLGYAGGGDSSAAVPEINTLTDVKDMLPFNVATQAALDLMGEGKLVEAEAAFSKIVAESPEAHSSSRIYLASLWEQQKRLDDAEQMYLAVLKLQPNHMNALFHLGGLYAEQGRYDEALKIYAQSVELEPDSALPLHMVGLTYARMGQSETAAQHFEQAMQLDPDFPGVRAALGVLHAKQGRVENAITFFESELELNPESIEAQVNLGVQLASQDRIEEARRHFEAGVRIAPSNVEARFNLGISLGKLGDYAGAVEQFQEAIRLQPNSTGVRTSLGNMLVKLERFDEALIAYREELERTPDSMEARVNLGALLGQRNQLDEAIEQLQQAVQRDPRNVEAQFNLGACYARKGDKAAAAEHLETVLRLKPGHVRAAAELEKLRETP